MKQKLSFKSVFILAIVVFSIAGMFLLYLLFTFSSDVKLLSENLIQQRVEKTRTRLDSFFKPLEIKLSFATNLQHIGLFDSIQNPEKLNQMFFQFLEESKQVSSILVADEKLNEYLVLDLDTCFYNRITYNGSKKRNPQELFWTLDVHKHKLISVIEKPELYSPETRPWYSQTNYIDSIYWTTPYIFFTTKDIGITISKKVVFENKTNTVAFDIKLNDISKYTTNIKNIHDEKVIILTEDGKIIGLPAYSEFKNVDLKKYFLKPVEELNKEEISVSFSNFKKSTNKINTIKVKNEKYDVLFEKYELSDETNLLIGVIIPETAIISDLKWKKSLLTGGTLLIGLMIVFLLISINKEIRISDLLREKNFLIEQTNGRLNQSLLEKDILVKEIHHRVKNNLQIVSGLLYLQSTVTKDKETKEAFKSSIDRITSMSLLHEKLYRSSNLTEINIQEYIRDLCHAILSSYDTNSRIAFKNDIKQIPLDIDQLVSIGLIVNELITNSLKHAFTNTESPEINIYTTFEIGKMVLVYQDNGIGLPDNFDFTKLNSLGMEIIRSLSKGLGTKISFENNNGLMVKLVFD